MSVEKAQSSLRALAESARAAGRFALDTEFMGEGRYRTQLCLIQLAVADTLTGTPHRAHPEGHKQAGGGGGERIEIVAPLTEEVRGGPLAHVLADPDVEVVVHAGRQDVALLRRYLGCEASNVFDTQVAAGFLGLPAQCSYDTLLSETLGVRVAKSASFTRWDARPLSPEQLSYAREDVAHLLELAAELRRRLDAAGRLAWAREECEYLEHVSDDRDLDAIFAKLPRVRGLSLASQTIARELVEWREETAAARDRPVQRVLADAVLVEIAKRGPDSIAKLEEIRGVGQSSLRRRGEEVLAAVRRGLERPQEPLQAGLRAPPPEPGDAPMIALSEALVRARAREAGLAYELLASRADLQAIVVGERLGERTDVRTLRGWRRELVGEELLDLLDGRVSLSVHDGRLEIGS